MTKIACIVNPKGRDGESLKRWKKVKQELEKSNVETEVHFTERIGHASEIAFSLRDRDDLDVIAACGGDGTVHEVASGLRGSKIPLGLIPAGTGNDVARAHGVPAVGQIKQIVNILINGKDRNCGAFRVQAVAAPQEKNYPQATQNSKWDGEPDIEGRVVRWSFLETDCGVTSTVSRSKLTNGKWIKGNIKYTYLGALEILKWKKRSAHIKINDESGQVMKNFNFFAATTSELFGGGIKVCPGASPISGKGTVCYSQNHSKAKMISMIDTMKKGKHIGKKGTTLRCNDVERLEISDVDKDGNHSEKSHEPMLIVNVDGEPSLRTPALLEYFPNQILIRGASETSWDNGKTDI